MTGERHAVTPVGYLETGVIFRKDNLACLREFPDECVDLVYLDPPFFSNRQYEVIWGDEAEVRSFDDRWKGGIREYVDWMRNRLHEMHRVLKSTGSIYVHCDPTASHYLKVTLDTIFGTDGFRNEIVWKRTPFSGSSKARAQQLPRSHDLIFFYTKGDGWTWNAPTTGYTDEYLKRFKWDDKDGRGLYRKTLLKTYSQETFERLKADNRLIEPVRAGAKYSYKQYLSESSGRRQIDDVWMDINALNPAAKERLGYPTQKPEALLERIIAASSNRGDVVLDPFCGCGTSIAVAQQMQRRWVGIDISPQAAKIMKRRVDGYGANANVVGLPATIEDLKALGHFEFQNWVIDTINGVQRTQRTGDMGVDGYTFFDRRPVQVKHSERVGRPVVDTFETAVAREEKDAGYIVAFSFTPGAYDEAARSREVGLTPVHLIRVEQLLELNDLVLAAEASRVKPDLSHVAPDLMALFAGALERRGAGRRTTVSKTDLFASAERERTVSKSEASGSET
jgi:DNA modification methylase